MASPRQRAHSAALNDAKQRNRDLSNEIHARQRLEARMDALAAMIQQNLTAAEARPAWSDAELIGVAAVVLTEGMLTPTRTRLITELERRGVWKRGGS
jgi:hypothetical protein